MKYALIAIALAFTATPAFAQKTADEPVPDFVTGYESGDARMNAAIAEARALLPLFFQEFSGTNAPGAFTIKVGLPSSDGGHEHIWVGELHYEGNQLVGALINEPYYLPGMRLGSRVVINNDEISDWTIATPDGVYGGFTTRVMLEDMPAAQAEEYRVGLQMAAQATPPWWVQ